MRGGLRHPPSIAGRTDAASFTRKGDKKVTTAIRAVGTGEAIGKDAAFQVASEVPLDIVMVPHDPPNPLHAPASGKSPGGAGRCGTGRSAQDDDGSTRPVDIPVTRRPLRLGFCAVLYVLTV